MDFTQRLKPKQKEQILELEHLKYLKLESLFLNSSEPVMNKVHNCVKNQSLFSFHCSCSIYF